MLACMRVAEDAGFQFIGLPGAARRRKSSDALAQSILTNCSSGTALHERPDSGGAPLGG
jgi:hypothetical protein